MLVHNYVVFVLSFSKLLDYILLHLSTVTVYIIGIDNMTEHHAPGNSATGDSDTTNLTQKVADMSVQVGLLLSSYMCL